MHLMGTAGMLPGQEIKLSHGKKDMFPIPFLQFLKPCMRLSKRLPKLTVIELGCVLSEEVFPMQEHTFFMVIMASQCIHEHGKTHIYKGSNGKAVRSINPESGL